MKNYLKPLLSLTVATLLTACSVPPYDESLTGGLTLLEAERFAEAREHFELAAEAGADEEEAALAEALVIESSIGEGRREEALRLVQRVLVERPRSFLSWKCAAAFHVCFGPREEAERAARGAQAAATNPIESAWADQVGCLLAAWQAFRGGDTREVLAVLRSVEHAELSVAAAHLRARAQRIEKALSEDRARAEEVGQAEGERDLREARSAKFPLLGRADGAATAIPAVGIAAHAAQAHLASPGPRLRVHSVDR